MRRPVTSWFKGWKITLHSTEFQCQDGRTRFTSSALLESSESQQLASRRSMVHTDVAFPTCAEANTDALSRAKHHINEFGAAADSGSAEKIHCTDDALTNRESVESLGARFEITFDGKRYSFRSYRYDRFQDALRYAMMEHVKCGFQRDQAFIPHWSPQFRPSKDDETEMRQHGIQFADGAFRLHEYRYERLEDALAYALKHPT